MRNKNYYVEANKERVSCIEKGIDEIPKYIDADKRIPGNKHLYEDYVNNILNTLVDKRQ